MDREHPIPQQISSYQFRLVGDMTIKQFFLVAGGSLVAIVFYSSSLAPFIKWPLIIISFLAGIAMAFFPLEDRPIQKWAYLFLKAIYSPTIFVWRKSGVKQLYFQPEPSPAPQKKIPEEKVKQPIKPKEEVEQSKETQKLEKGEQEILTEVEKQFGQGVELPIPLEIDLDKPQEEILPKRAEEERSKAQVIQQTPVKIDRSEKIYQAPPPMPEETSETGSEVTPFIGEEIEGLQKAQFSQDAAPPSAPSQTNIVVGQVMDAEGKILENAILEIKDSEGRPVRALKSNKLGHFMIVTPLSDGKYELITEADGYEFSPVEIIMKGKIVSPIAIRARAKNEGVSN